jgi:hypothetical protein
MASGVHALKLEPAEIVEIRAPGGSSAAIVDDSIVVRDRGGAVVVVFDERTGSATIAAPAGDLRLSAPRGRVVLDAAMDVSVTAGRDLVQQAGRRIAIGGGETAAIAVDDGAVRVVTPEVSVSAERTRVEIADARVQADRLETVAAEVVWAVGKLTIGAERLFERVVDAYRDVEGLLQTRAGRVRTVVEDTYQLTSRKTTLASTDDTSIDGKRVLLG